MFPLDAILLSGGQDCSRRVKDSQTPLQAVQHIFLRKTFHFRWGVPRQSSPPCPTLCAYEYTFYLEFT